MALRCGVQKLKYPNGRGSSHKSTGLTLKISLDSRLTWTIIVLIGKVSDHNPWSTRPVYILIIKRLQLRAVKSITGEISAIYMWITLADGIVLIVPAPGLLKSGLITILRKGKSPVAIQVWLHVVSLRIVYHSRCVNYICQWQFGLMVQPGLALSVCRIEISKMLW